jgi:hypothetical protein
LLCQRLLKSFGEGMARGDRRQQADPRDPRRLLRVDGERRGERTGQRGQQEAAAVHYSIT